MGRIPGIGLAGKGIGHGKPQKKIPKAIGPICFGHIGHYIHAVTVKRLRPGLQGWKRVFYALLIIQGIIGGRHEIGRQGVADKR